LWQHVSHVSWPYRPNTVRCCGRSERQIRCHNDNGDDDHDDKTDDDTIMATAGPYTWLRRLVVGISLRRAGFSSRPAYVGFVMDKSILGQVITSKYFGFPCQYLSTNARYSFVHVSSTLCNLSNRQSR
jgi:hypothetical protein